MLKKLKFLFFLILLSAILISPAQAYLNGGYVNGITAGDCYLTYGAWSVSSNTVNVNTVRIENVISDRTVVSTNMAAIPVSVSVTNTGVVATNFNLALRIYNNTLGAPAGGDGSYVVVANFGNPINLAAGTTATYSFTVDATGLTVATFPVIVDAITTAVVPPFGNDAYWIAIDGSAVTGAVNPLFWDSRNGPFPSAVTINPQFSGGALTSFGVTFDRTMDDTSIPVFDAVSSDGTTVVGTFVGGSWTSAANTVNWTCVINTVGWAEGRYFVSGSGALDSGGSPMGQQTNLIFFEIDRSPPTPNLIHALNAAPGLPFAVRLVCVDQDVIPLAPILWTEFLLTNGTTVNIPVGGWVSVGGQGITWDGTVLVPVNATPNAIATFNMVRVTDDVGLVGTVINSGPTFNVSNAMPYITNLTFDGIAVINGDTINSAPLIRFLIVDGANTGDIPTESIRVTRDGVRIVSGSSLTLVGTIPFNTYECLFQIDPAMNEGSYRFEFGAQDDAGTYAIPLVITLRVYEDGDVELIRSPINWTNPFSPNGDGVEDVTYIIYELTKSSAVSIVIFNMDGEVVWRMDIDEGDEGGHAGYNSVMWDGMTSFGNDLPNGVYIAHIVVKAGGEKKSLGRARIVILK